jgi:hypothetical protein
VDDVDRHAAVGGKEVVQLVPGFLDAEERRLLRRQRTPVGPGITELVEVLLRPSRIIQRPPQPGRGQTDVLAVDAHEKRR